MANKHFKFFNDREYKTYRKLTDESIEISGITFYYIPRVTNNLDYLYGEDALSSFEEKHEMTAYLKNFENWDGSGDIYAKFGLELSDELTVEIETERFFSYTGMEAPMIGDLIYAPFANTFFEISYVDPDEIFFHLGKSPTYVIKCKIWEYSHESITVDKETQEVFEDITNNDDEFSDNTNIDTEDDTDSITDFSETNLFGEN